MQSLKRYLSLIWSIGCNSKHPFCKEKGELCKTLEQNLLWIQKVSMITPLICLQFYMGSKRKTAVFVCLTNTLSKVGMQLKFTTFELLASSLCTPGSELSWVSFPCKGWNIYYPRCFATKFCHSWHQRKKNDVSRYTRHKHGTKIRPKIYVY